MKNSKKKTLPLLIILLNILAFGLGFFVNEQVNKNRIATLRDELSLTTTDLEFANKDLPKVLETKIEIYPVKDLPIQSKLFEGKEIEVNDLLFKGKNLKEYIIYMSDRNQAFPTKVTIWDYHSDNADRFNHTLLVDKFRTHRGIEYITPNNKNIYNAKSGFAWNKAEQKLSRLHESTSNHAILIDIEDTNVIIGRTYWDGSVPQDLQVVADSIGFN